MSTNTNFTEPPASLPPDEIPHPVRPMRRTGGWVFPGRGVNTHGVDPNAAPHPVPELFDEAEVIPAEQAPPERANVPVPVRIVTDGPRESKEWRTFQESAGQSVRQVVSHMKNRTSLHLQNDGAVTVWVGPDNRVSKQTGFALKSGASMSLDGYGAVFAFSDDGTEQAISGYFEYVIELP